MCESTVYAGTGVFVSVRFFLERSDCKEVCKVNGEAQEMSGRVARVVHDGCKCLVSS